MIGYLVAYVGGALTLYLVLDNNPKLAAKLKTVKDIVEKKIEDKLGKDI